MNLKTDYKNISWNGLRKYEMIDNGDGTVSFRDVTQYTNVQDSNILANVLNTANDAINRMMNGEIFYTEAEVDALLALKQSVLTFDNAPTSGSSNPVKSSGIKTALDALSTRIDNLNVFSFHICTSGEYDPVTGQPTIQNPDGSTFYLVPTGTSPDVFTEWIYVNNAWEKFGSTTVDLSNYVTTSDLADALDDKQDVLTFDSTPTDNSDNPVTSDGIYDALLGKSDTSHDHDSRYYTEAEMDILLAGKSDTSHDHDGRYYTETEVDTLLGAKQDVSSSYTSAEVDTLLSAKVDNTSIGTMAAVNDAPSNGSEYVRKNGDWAVASGGSGSVFWGDISGSISSQTDLQTALDGKTDQSIIAPEFSASTSYSAGEFCFYNDKLYVFTDDHAPGAWDPIHVYEVKVSGVLEAKADKISLGDLAYKNTVDWTSDISNIPVSFPPETHTHFASDITSGTLSTAYGGTGKSSLTTYAVLTGGGLNQPVNLIPTASGAFYATAAAHSATFGTLPVAQGGIGVTEAAANKIFAGPSSGSDSAPSFRSLVANDIPNLNASKITAGTLAVARGGTNASTASANQVFAGPSSGNAAAPSFRSLAAADIPNLNASKITAGTLAVGRGGTGRDSITTFMREDLKLNRFTIAASGGTQTIKYGSGEIMVIFWMRATTYGVALTSAYNDTVNKVIDYGGTTSPTITNDTDTDTVTIKNNRSSTLSVMVFGGTLQ